MPEYSSTTLTPSDSTQVPGMQGSNAGNFQLNALKAYILAEKAQANGLASLDANGKLTASQLPDLADDVIVVASYATLPATGTAGKLYITADNNKMYRWDPDLATPDYVELSVDLSDYATIADLQDGTIEPLISTKAKQDQNGNVIDQTYETKAEAFDLKSAIDQHESRLENLEQKAGDYTTVQYRGTNAVPTGKAKYGLVKSIVGKTRAWNQLQYNGNCASQDGWQNGTVSNGYIQGSANAGEYWQTYNSLNLSPIIQGHVYLVIARLTSVSGLSSGTTYFNLRINDSGSSGNAVSQTATSIADGASVMLQGIFTATSTHAGLSPLKYWGVHNDTNAHTQRWSDMALYDLTLIFGSGNEPSTVADALAQLSALGEYNAYDDGSLVDTQVSGVKSVGVNIWDEEWEVGSYYTTTGEKRTLTDRIRSANSYSVNANTEYYFLVPYSSTISGFAVILFYDANGGYLSYTNVSSNGDLFTTPPNCATITFFVSSSYGTTYNHDIQICLNSYADKTTYHPYKTDTISLSTPVTLKSAGSVADKRDVESGKVTHFVKRIDLGNLTYSYASNVQLFYAGIDDGVQSATAEGTGRGVCSRYVVVKKAYVDMVDYEMIVGSWIGGTSRLYIALKNSNYTDPTAFKNSLSGVYLDYELATPTTESIDPVIDNFIEVEGGGTIDTIQEQTPVIDNCLDVGYLTV